MAIGASAGGVEALLRLVRELPEDLPAAVLVVLHVSRDGASQLPAILARAGRLPAAHAENGDRLEAGRILVAPPDRHLLVDDGRARVVRGPRENFHRPSVDVLFRSAALSKDGGVVAIVLSGALDDGVSGMRAVRALGGTTVVQSPADAIFPSMPASVVAALEPDHVLPADEIGRRVADLVVAGSPRAGEPDPVVRAGIEREVRMARMERGAYDADPPGVSSPFGCPECGGVLWETEEGNDPRYRCRVGHAYTARALLAAEEHGVEDALWAGLRALEEQETLARRMLDRPWTRDSTLRRRLRDRARISHERAETLRKFLAGSDSKELRTDDSPELAPVELDTGADKAG